MSRVPMGSDGGAIAVDPQIAFENYFVPQGIGADIIATKYGFSRDEADAMAVESQRRAKAAWDAKRFARSIVGVRDVNGLSILDHDEYMRPSTDMQTLGALKPAFQQIGEMMPGFDNVALLKYPELERINHIHHAGNSSASSMVPPLFWSATRRLVNNTALSPRAHPRHCQDRLGPDHHAHRPPCP